MKEYHEYLGRDPNNERLKFRPKKELSKKDKIRKRKSKSWNKKYGDDIDVVNN